MTTEFSRFIQSRPVVIIVQGNIMPNNRNFTRSILVLFILNLSVLMAGCGGSSDGSIKTIDSTVIIDASVTEGGAPLDVKFNLASDDFILGASWNFGDGETSIPVNPNSSVKHTFIADGTYTVNVKADTNSGGTQTDTITITVGSGISPTVTMVLFVNDLDASLYSVVGNSSVGDTDFNFLLQSTIPGDDTPGLIEQGETGFIEMKCDVSWELDAYFNAGSDFDAGHGQLEMQLFSCGVTYTCTFESLQIPDEINVGMRCGMFF